MGLALLSPFSSHAQDNNPYLDPDFHVSPGNVGPNAFTNWIWRVDDAQIIPNDKIIVDLSYRSVKDRFENITPTGVVRVEIPFSTLSSLEITYLAEKWNLNDDGMAHYFPSKRSGFNMGDIVGTYKYRLLKEGPKQPSMALHASLKTASGNFDDRRFTDSSGYSVDVLIAKDILHATGALRTIRVLGEAGFMAWDDGAHSQNDAYRYGMAARFEFQGNANITFGYHGYTGWRHNGDNPSTFYIEAHTNITKNLGAFAALDLGLKSAASPSTLSGGLRYLIPRIAASRRKPPTP